MHKLFCLLVAKVSFERNVVIPGLRGLRRWGSIKSDLLLQGSPFLLLIFLELIIPMLVLICVLDITQQPVIDPSLYFDESIFLSHFPFFFMSFFCPLFSIGRVAFGGPNVIYVNQTRCNHISSFFFSLSLALILPSISVVNVATRLIFPRMELYQA